MNWLVHVKGACHLDVMLCMKEEALPEVSTVLLQGIQCVGFAPTVWAAVFLCVLCMKTLLLAACLPACHVSSLPVVMCR